MSMIYKELREASDEDLIEAHDKIAQNTVVGTAYYLQELNRRDAERLDRSIRRLTVVNVALVIVSTAAVILEVWRSFGS